MMHHITAKLGRKEDEDGFTLIELMVVVLIIAILMAIAIPTFLGARNTANARAAQSDVRNALTTEQTYFTNNSQAYGGAAGVAPLETGLVFSDATLSATVSFTGATYYQSSGTNAITAPSGAPQGNIVFIDNANGTASPPVVTLMAVGKDNKCYFVQDTNGAVTYGIGTYTTTCTTPTTYGAKW